MRITLYRNNPHAPNGLMSQEELECDDYALLTDESGDGSYYADAHPNRRTLLINRSDFAAILVDTRSQT